jgi:hypothetical protein
MLFVGSLLAAELEAHSRIAAGASSWQVRVVLQAVLRVFDWRL